MLTTGVGVPGRVQVVGVVGDRAENQVGPPADLDRRVDEVKQRQRLAVAAHRSRRESPVLQLVVQRDVDSHARDGTGIEVEGVLRAGLGRDQPCAAGGEGELGRRGIEPPPRI